MKLRLQADADLNHHIVAALRRLEPAIDFQSATDADLEGRSDPTVLGECARHGRLLVTHDQRTMPHHFGMFVAEKESPGVLIVPQSMPIREAVQELYLAWVASDAAEWVNAIRRLPL